MGKYLELFRGEVGDLTEKTKLENKPYVAYSTKLGKVTYTVVTTKDPVVEGPANNEIWYTTSDGSLLEIYYDKWTEQDCYDLFSANLVSNTYNNGKGVMTFDDTLTEISGNAFSNKSLFGNGDKILTIIFPNTITVFDGGSLYGCKLLKEFVVPSSVKILGGNVFNYCNSLTNVTIPEGVTEIGDQTFANCLSLANIVIPSSVTSIEDRAFLNCYFQKGKFVNNSSLDAETNNYWGAKIVDQITENGLYILDSVVVAANIYKINENKSVIIPDGVTTIDNDVFKKSQLKSITIPTSVIKIGDSSFEELNDFSINYLGTKSQWNQIEKSYTWAAWTNDDYYVTVHCTDGDLIENVDAA